MRRARRHKIKHEKPETSSAFAKASEEHDLAYFIHDRVELMHQVFSVLKPKDLKAMAPECVRRLTIDDLEELCTEELLGISSKRLLAILDGCDPPSDTESSSQSSGQVEAISLDSISSDEEILSQASKKKRNKHKRHDSKSKKHKNKKTETTAEEDPEKMRASRAGLTVLELLELQARARAIRAQLQQEQAKRIDPVTSTGDKTSIHSSDSEIEIKEEPAEVVEIISSDDEKPSIERLEKALEATTKEQEKLTAEVNETVSTAEPTENNKEAKKKKKEKKKKEKGKDKEKIKESSNEKEDKTRKESTSSKESEKESVKEQSNEKNNKDSNDVIEIENNIVNAPEVQNTVTKRVNNLIITVPQQTTRKIKLNRSKMTVSIPNSTKEDVTVVEKAVVNSVVIKPKQPEAPKRISSVVNRPQTVERGVNVVSRQEKDGQEEEKTAEKAKNKDKVKKKQKKKEKRHSIDEDHDEIMLQLSDSEKMDLLENFDRKNYDDVSSSSDSESSSSDSDTTENTQNSSKELEKSHMSNEELSSEKAKDNVAEANANATEEIVAEVETVTEKEQSNTEVEKTNTEIFVEDCKDDKTDDSTKDYQNDDKENASIDSDKTAETNNFQEIAEDCVNLALEPETSEKEKSPKTTEITAFVSAENEENAIEISKIDDIPLKEDTEKDESVSESKANDDKISNSPSQKESNQKHNEDVNNEVAGEGSVKDLNENSKTKTIDKELSEGEISSNESSEVEALEPQAEVVCISDEETPKNKKKDKKAKKEKKKKESDFRESADENFYKESNAELQEKNEAIVLEDDDVFEILELSDDSSCYEVEGTTLSKEPTVEEIAALSAKIDEIDRDEVITEEEIQIFEINQQEKEKNLEESNTNKEIENISWKDRYLDSKKVKRVLTTSNILNALRKKNKELKKKMEESKKKELELLQQKLEEDRLKEIEEKEKVLEEGSIEQYNALQGSTKYVDPIPDPVEIAKKKEEELKEQQSKAEEALKEQQKVEEEEFKRQEKEVEKAIESQVTGEMKTDAKQLLKMYKMLLKYNDIKKQKARTKKKNKKKRKKEKEAANCA